MRHPLLSFHSRVEYPIEIEEHEEHITTIEQCACPAADRRQAWGLRAFGTWTMAVTLGRPQERKTVLLYLDIDGCLHPARASLAESQEGLPDFAWTPILVKILRPHPEVKIVVSSTWRVIYSRSELAKFLAPLNIHGVTASWPGSTRFKEIERHAHQEKAAHWLAIDDEDEGWPSKERHRLILTRPETGISNPESVAELAAKLAGGKRDALQRPMTTRQPWLS